MKIIGTYPPKRRVFIPAEIKIDNLNLVGSANFLVDTGSNISFINESTALKIGLDYSNLLQVDKSTGIGGEAELYQIDGFTRLTFESAGQVKTIPRKNFLAMKHSFCEHIPQDAQKKILGLEGVFGMDMIRGWCVTITGGNYTIDVR